jgi:serine/threonine protein kinase
MYQLLCAVHYCATANVIHRDLKPSNILVNSACALRVCDFGLARGSQSTSDDLTTYVVTRWYRAPELILACDHYSSAIDMWSVGCIFAELIARRPLFAGEDFLHQLRLICEVLGSPTNEDLAFMSEGSANRYLRDMDFQPHKPWREVKGLEGVSDDALDLLNKMLTFSPRNRITAYQALKHPYLKTYQKQPIRSAPEPFDIEAIERINMTRKQLREAMSEEISYYRGDSYERAAAAQGSSGHSDAASAAADGTAASIKTTASMGSSNSTPNSSAGPEPRGSVGERVQQLRPLANSAGTPPPGTPPPAPAGDRD